MNKDAQGRRKVERSESNWKCGYTWNQLAITAPSLNAIAALANNLSVLSIVPDRPLSTGVKGGNGGGGKPPKDGGGGGGPTLGGTQQLVTAEVQRVGPPSATSDGTGIGIAILDTGVDFGHADLPLAPDDPGVTSFNAFNLTGSAQDVWGHGTGVAGLTAAKNNNIDILGVASGATLYAVKVLGDNGIGEESHSIAGLQWVADNYNLVTPNIRVVNMSLGRELLVGEDINKTPLLGPIRTLYELGIPVITSAGNNPAKIATEMVPAGYQEVIAVGATVTIGGHSQCPESLFGPIPLVPADTAASFTTDGEFLNGRGITISAPGEAWSDTFWPGSFSCLFFYGVRTTMLGGGASRKIRQPDGDFEARGTSFAAPLVTGAVARIMQLGLVAHTGDGTEVELIRTYLRDNADRKAASPGDTNAAPLDHP